ncbi:replication termination factor 2-like [Planococcus citri]|uniref:replication termination factor 2-like n=1 Tax=Planococcus citri TaxID=170843 RepID=UPI0031F970A9
MGCDGGTIPKRDELVRLKKKPEQKDKVAELSFRWQHCAISHEPLRKPIVACGLGRLYNKDTVIEKLLDKTSKPESISHIKRLKDVKDLNLTENSAYKAEDEKGDNRVDRQTAPYICPVSGLEMSGKFKFCFFWSCGCVLAERAIKQFQEKSCLKCQTPYTDDDIVIMNAADQDLELMTTRNKLRQKSSKKIKVKVEPNDEPVASTSSTIFETVKVKKESEDEKLPIKKPTEIKREKGNSSVTPLAAATKSKKRSLEGMCDPAYKKTKQSYSISKDSKATDVFKSLFTSHDDAKSQTKAHWVTYNPFYN